MPLTSEEVLKALVEATTEAKATIRGLHEARAATRDVVKAQHKAIRDAIEEFVSKAVSEMEGEARKRMREAADEMILTVERDFRAALRLDPR